MSIGPIFTRITPIQAMSWFKKEILKLGSSLDEDMSKSQEKYITDAVEAGLFRSTGDADIGQMFLFKYDPKYKHRLPYWDEFPLVFPLDNFSGGFLAINLHYLPSEFRTVTLNHLVQFKNDSDKYDYNERLNISYDILKQSGIVFNSFYKGCVRKYLFTHIRSSYHYIKSENWNNVAALPFERWVFRK